ncbi:hypothetical protein V6Z11_A07G177700 [Gossypium hirsutum]
MHIVHLLVLIRCKCYFVVMIGIRTFIGCKRKPKMGIIGFIARECAIYVVKFSS